MMFEVHFFEEHFFVNQLAGIITIDNVKDALAKLLRDKLVPKLPANAVEELPKGSPADDTHAVCPTGRPKIGTNSCAIHGAGVDSCDILLGTRATTNNAGLKAGPRGIVFTVETSLVS